MVARCLPIFLLRVPSQAAQADRATKAAIISRNCLRFLQGNWRSLAATSQQELEVCNARARNRHSDNARAQPPSTASKHDQVLDHARKLHYSKAMNLL
jgi:hypothetical protein